MADSDNKAPEQINNPVVAAANAAASTTNTTTNNSAAPSANNSGSNDAAAPATNNNAAGSNTEAGDATGSPDNAYDNNGPAEDVETVKEVVGTSSFLSMSATSLRPAKGGEVGGGGVSIYQNSPTHAKRENECFCVCVRLCEKCVCAALCIAVALPVFYAHPHALNAVHVGCITHFAGQPFCISIRFSCGDIAEKSHICRARVCAFVCMHEI